MTERWIRVRPSTGDTVAAGVVAGALAAGVGLVTFYVLRTLLAREPLDEPASVPPVPPVPPVSSARGGEGEA